MPQFHSVFSTSINNGHNINEALFAKFYEVTSDKSLKTKLTNIIDPNGEISKLLPVRPFIGVFLQQLMADLIERRSSLFFKEVEKTNNALSDSDQSVLFYISGYIISKMSKNRTKVKLTHKQELVKETVEHFLKNEKDSEKTFITKFSIWTDKMNRGGLKIPSDNFYLFIRECEMCCRESIDEKNLHTNTYCIVNLREKIMENQMVKYYIEKIAKGKLASHIIEKCISLFLTVRGNSCARKTKLQVLNCEEKKSIRAVLKEKSINKMQK